MRKDVACYFCERFVVRSFDYSFNDFLQAHICEHCHRTWWKMSDRRIPDGMFRELSDDDFNNLVNAMGVTIWLEKLHTKLCREIARAEA